MASTRSSRKALRSGTDQEVRKRAESFKDLKGLFTQAVAADNDYKLAPEIVNRIAAYLIANPISRDTAVQIARLEVDKNVELYRERNGIGFDLSKEIAPYIVDRTFNIAYGVRDLSRAVERFFSELTKSATRGDVRGRPRRTGAKRNWGFSVRADEGTITLRSDGLRQEGRTRPGRSQGSQVAP